MPAKITLELTPEEALHVHEALKRQKTREFARAGYWSKEESTYVRGENGAKGTWVSKVRDQEKADLARARGEAFKAIVARIIEGMKALG